MFSSRLQDYETGQEEKKLLHQIFLRETPHFRYDTGLNAQFCPSQRKAYVVITD